jgi:hypothetical protein
MHMGYATRWIVKVAFFNLGIGAKVDHGAQANVGELVEFGVREAMDGIGTKEGAPLDRSTVGGGVTAEITEVEGAFETQVAIRVDGCEREIGFIHEGEATCSRRVHVGSLRFFSHNTRD